MKTKTILICLLLGISFGGTYYFLSKKNDATTTRVTGNLIDFKKSDKLFTTFLYTPIMDVKKGFKNMDWMKFGGIKNAKEVPVGYCLREYEVGIGYENIKELIEKYKDLACRNGYYKDLPNPIILSTNAISSESKGEYSTIDCDKWDYDSNGRQKSKSRIYQQLEEDGNWVKICDNSKKILNSYIRIYCPLAVAESEDSK